MYYGDDEGVSSSASSDLRHATHMAKVMVTELGMDSEFGLAVDTRDTMSNDVRARVNEILNEQMQRTIATLRENKAAIDRLVEQLVTKYYLSGEEAEKIVKDVK